MADLRTSCKRILRHSTWDVLLIALSLAHGLVLLLAPSIPVIALGLWWNANTISHSFIHLPFFRSNRANHAYALYLTLLLGFPQSLWRRRHLAHHSGKRPETWLRPSIAFRSEARRVG